MFLARPPFPSMLAECVDVPVEETSNNHSPKDQGTVEPVWQRSVLCLWLRCVAQVLFARGQVFGVDSSWEQRSSLFLRHAGRNHHTVSRLEEDRDREETRLLCSTTGWLSTQVVSCMCVVSCWNNCCWIGSLFTGVTSCTFQSTGVATFLPAVSWSESTTRKISSKLRPVVAGYRSDSFSLFSGPMMNTYTKLERAKTFCSTWGRWYRKQAWKEAN